MTATGSHHTLRRSVLASIFTAALTLLTIHPAVAADDTVTTIRTYTSTHGDYGVRLGQHSVGGGLQATVFNNSANPQDIAMGSDLAAQGEPSLLWLTNINDFSTIFEHVTQPGETYTQDIPTWPGETYTFYEDAGGSQPELGSYTIPGNWLPVAFLTDSDDNLSDIHVGYDLQLSRGEVPAGGSLQVSASIPDQTTLQAYIVPETNIDNAFNTETFVVDPQMAAGLKKFVDPAQVRRLNPIPVTAAGVSNAVVNIPVDLAPGNYALFLGDKARGYYPAGPYSANQNTNLTVTAPGTTQAGQNVAITPVDQDGNAPVDFTFTNVSQAGTTTVQTSTTGPTPSNFTAVGTYYDLHTTATFAGSVRVCVNFDPGTMDTTTASSQHLYHYVNNAWVDITVESGYGYACGNTDSFSPFVLGTPKPVAPALKFLTPTKASGNVAVAGFPYPVSFKGAKGLTLAAGYPQSQQVNCKTGAAIGTVLTTPTNRKPALVYAAKLGTYALLWDTSKAWRNTCRTFTLKLSNGSVGSATFTLK